MLDVISPARLSEVCSEKWPESQTLDFKVTLPGKDEKGRKDFLADVCAMANADGGDIVYGVAEVNGAASVLKPITGEDPDAAKRRLGQTIEAGIEPRPPQHEFRDVGLPGGGYALVLQIPASYVGPHRGAGRFMLRSNSHNAEMSYDQLRRAFDRTATLTDAARQSREKRLSIIAAGGTWRPTPPPWCVMHAVPLQAMSGRIQLDVSAAHDDFSDLIVWSGSTGRSTNLDGLIVHPAEELSIGGRTFLPGYTQLFRQGAIETVWTGRALVTDEPYIPSADVTIFYRNSVRMALGALRKRDLTGPVILAAAFLRVGNYKFAVDAGRFPFLHQSVTQADRSDLLLPETWIDDVAAPLTNVDNVARPMLDVLWQAFGQVRCVEYTPDGRFRPHG